MHALCLLVLCLRLYMHCTRRSQLTRSQFPPRMITTLPHLLYYNNNRLTTVVQSLRCAYYLNKTSQMSPGICYNPKGVCLLLPSCLWRAAQAARGPPIFDARTMCPRSMCPEDSRANRHCYSHRNNHRGLPCYAHVQTAVTKAMVLQQTDRGWAPQRKSRRPQVERPAAAYLSLSLYIYIYIYIYTYMYMYMCIYIYMCMYTYI